MLKIPEVTRMYLYRVALSLLSVAVLLKLVGPEEVSVYAEVAMAVLGLGSSGLATAYTRPRPVLSED